MEKVFVYTGTATQPNITITRQEYKQLRGAWELVRRLAAEDYDNAELAASFGYLEEFDVDACKFCHKEGELGDDLIWKVREHYPDCIWLQARQLVKGE